MRRREFIIAVGSAALPFLRTARAQQPEKLVRIGVFGAVPRGDVAIQTIFDALASLGYREGENLSVEFRELGDDAQRIAAMAGELVRANLDVILVDGPEAPLQAVLAAG